MLVTQNRTTDHVKSVGATEQWSREKTVSFQTVFDNVALKQRKVCGVGFLWNSSSFLITFKPSPI